MNIPDGYRVEETGEFVACFGTRRTRRGADALARRHPPAPSYHLRVRRRGFLRWEVAAYQNRLVPSDRA